VQFQLLLTCATLGRCRAQVVIAKQDILERAREWNLRPDVVEKDYVLGWVLAAVASHDEASALWVLKGGTCVKKCFVETYRFSEDLDFSLLPEAAYKEEELREILRSVTQIAHELSGIEFDSAALGVRQRRDPLGRVTFEGKIGYRGPLAVPGPPRILFDLTQHEPIVDEPVRRAILHPYPDALPEDALVQTYSIEELLAEKTRALIERSRPRDLYDVVYLVENVGAGIALDHTREVFGDKCRAKEIAVPNAARVVVIVAEAEELRAEWDNMLAHQLPQLPPVAAVIARLDAAVTWLDVAAPPEVSRPPVISRAPAESIEAPAASRLWRTGVPLETIRFAGANRLLVRFWYNGRRRTVEPYSLRRSTRGNLLLYAWEIDSSQIKAFDVSKMSQVEQTQQTFAPRYQVEFLSSGAITAPSLMPSRGFAARRRAASGPAYIVVCPVCGKEFRRRRRDTTLRRHKAKDRDWYCSGTRGYVGRVE